MTRQVSLEACLIQLLPQLELPMSSVQHVVASQARIGFFKQVLVLDHLPDNPGRKLPRLFASAVGE